MSNTRLLCGQLQAGRYIFEQTHTYAHEPGTPEETKSCVSGRRRAVRIQYLQVKRAVHKHGNYFKLVHGITRRVLTLCALTLDLVEQLAPECTHFVSETLQRRAQAAIDMGDRWRTESYLKEVCVNMAVLRDRVIEQCDAVALESYLYWHRPMTVNERTDILGHLCITLVRMCSVLAGIDALPEKLHQPYTLIDTIFDSRHYFELVAKMFHDMSIEAHEHYKAFEMP